MEEITAFAAGASKVCWENLETFARGEIQRRLRRLLEAEIPVLPGPAWKRRRRRSGW
jgi:hypothetical protein